MRSGGVDIGIGAVTKERCPRSKERPCRIDDVVEEDARFSGDVSHDMVHVGLACTWAVFMEDCEGGREGIREFLRSLCATDVGRDYYWKGKILCTEVLCEDRSCMDGIHGNLKESLDLVAVEIEGDDVVCAGFLEEMSDKLCGDGFARFSDAVLARVGEVRDDDMNGGGETEFCCLAEEEEFHDVLVRCTTSCLEEVDGVSSDRFLEADVPFSATERSQRDLSQGDMQFAREMFGEILVR